MSDPILKVDPRIYGGDAPTGDAVPDFDPMTVGKAKVITDPPERVSQEGIAEGSASAADGANAIANNARPSTGILQSSFAAVKTWSPVRVWDSINQPDFEPEEGFDVKPYVNSVPFVLDHETQRFLAESKSQQEFSYRLQNTQDQRALYQQMGDHPVIAGLIGMADPGYLALDVLSGGVGAVAQGVGASVRAARIASAIAGAGSTYALGKVVQGQVPTSDTEVILPALVSGAAGAFFYRPGKGLVKADPEYPSDALNRAAGGVADNAAGVEQRIVAESRDAAESGVSRQATTTDAAAIPGNTAKNIDASAVAAEVPTATVDGMKALRGLQERGVKATDTQTDAYTYLARHENDPEVGPMIRTLRQEQPDLLNQLNVVESDTGRSFYSTGSHTAVINIGEGRSGLSKPATALHEVIHGLTSHKLNYGINNPGSAHGQIVSQLQGLRQEVQKAVASNSELSAQHKHLATYFSGDVHEFVAGLFSGKSAGFAELLSKIPAQGAPNMLSKLADTVRKLLGIPPGQSSALTKALGLTDELMRNKLKVEGLPGGDSILSAPSGTASQQASTIMNRMEKLSAKNVGQKISWSLHKTMASLGTAGKKVADLLVDDPVNMRADSVVSQKTAIRSGLAAKQYQVEELIKEEMAARGAGTLNRNLKWGSSFRIQQSIEREVFNELERRNSLAREGQPFADPSISPAITKIADAHDAATKLALKEMKDAGVAGADLIDDVAGYATRKWAITKIDELENRLQANGLSDKQARAGVHKMVSDSIAASNPRWDRQVSEDVARAILDRARRKGYFEDQAFHQHLGGGAAKEVRDILEQGGVPAARVQRVLDAITGVTDEAGKSANLKHRVALDSQMQHDLGNGVQASVADLLDTSTMRNLDGYLDNAAGNSALARKGLVSNSDITALRTEYLKQITDSGERAKAADLFDNVIANIKGQPVGEAMSDFMRKLQAITQMVGLSMSGLWQLTEYATPLTKFGLVKTTGEIMRTMPVFKHLMGKGMLEDGGAANLSKVLSRNSYQDMRMRPYLQKMEDNFETNLGDTVALALNNAKQLVPYINGMRYIHHHQATVVGNLIADTFHQAVNGSAKAREALTKYGLEGHTLDSIRSDIQKNGLNTELWSDATWQQIRGPLSKMMDDSVLKNRTGELPAFAQFSSVGKFIFTFRSFVLGAHNKVLAGSLGREGYGGLGLLMAYQFPLTMLAAQVNNTAKGGKDMDLAKTASTALSQMGAMGLLSELWGIASGDKQQFGASGLMAIDRLYKTGSAVANGQFGTAASGAIQSIPLLSIIPGVKAMASTLPAELNMKKDKE